MLHSLCFLTTLFLHFQLHFLLHFFTILTTLCDYTFATLLTTLCTTLFATLTMLFDYTLCYTFLPHSLPLWLYFSYTLLLHSLRFLTTLCCYTSLHFLTTLFATLFYYTHYTFLLHFLLHSLHSTTFLLHFLTTLTTLFDYTFATLFQCSCPMPDSIGQCHSVDSTIIVCIS